MATKLQSSPKSPTTTTARHRRAAPVRKRVRRSSEPTTSRHSADQLPEAFRAEVVWREPDQLAVDPRNARTHTPKQIQQIAASIREFGFTNPILVDARGLILAGHGRVEAAKLLGLDELPTIRLDHLTESQKRAYVLADNRLAELAGWDPTLLAQELEYLSALDLEFDVEVTGFETAQIDLLIGDAAEHAAESAALEAALSDRSPVVSRPGDLWELGAHRLYCGDALDEAAYVQLMQGQQAQMVFTDPPYNVRIDGHVGGSGRIHHAEFAMASGEMSEAEFTSFLQTVCTRLAAHSMNGAVHFICMDWRHMRELLDAGAQVYTEFKNLCVWNKDNAGMGSFYRSKHELVFVFKHGTAPHINNFGLGQHGRYRTNVWDYAGVNTLKPGRMKELEMHPTVKPVAMVADAIRDCSRRGSPVLDAFSGSGTTIIAAERNGRVARALELEPRYVDVAIRRWQQETGAQARLAGSEKTFEELSAERRRHTHVAARIEKETKDG